MAELKHTIMGLGWLLVICPFGSTRPIVPGSLNFAPDFSAARKLQGVLLSLSYRISYDIVIQSEMMQFNTEFQNFAINFKSLRSYFGLGSGLLCYLAIYFTKHPWTIKQ